MKIIRYTSYSELRLRVFVLYSILIFLGLVLGFIAWLIAAVLKLKDGVTFLYIIFLFSSYIPLWFFYKYTKPKYLDQIINNYFGKRGEDKVEVVLRNYFDDSFTYIRNFRVPDTFGDIDGLLIGPKGIFLVEVKTPSDDYKIINGIFYKNTKFGYKKVWFSPIRQIQRQRDNLQVYLKRNMINLSVDVVVVYAHGTIKIQGPTGVFVTELDKFPDYLNEVKTKELEKEVVDRVRILLGDRDIKTIDQCF